MALSFAQSTKLIGVPQVDAQPLTLQALINAIRTEEASERGIVYDQIADASGKDDLGGGVSVGITVALRSSWKLDFAAGAYQATIDGGNLSDALSRINNTGSPQVLVLSSAAATAVDTGGGSAPTAEQNAAAVWNALVASHNADSTRYGYLMPRVISMANEVGGILGRLTGTGPVTFFSFTVNGASQFNGPVTYSGGIDVYGNAGLGLADALRLTGGVNGDAVRLVAGSGTGVQFRGNITGTVSGGITAQNVWDYLLANANIAGSIGQRMKDVLTVANYMALKD